MKQLILTPDVNEVSMQKETLSPPKIPPFALDQAAKWLEEMQHRLNLCTVTMLIYVCVHQISCSSLQTGLTYPLRTYYTESSCLWISTTLAPGTYDTLMNVATIKEEEEEDSGQHTKVLLETHQLPLRHLQTQCRGKQLEGKEGSWKR